MLKKIAAAAVLAGALAFSAAAPAVLSAGSTADTTGVSVATGNWPDPMSKPVKEKGQTYTTNTGNWPDPM
ncbi:UNVERIFIED_ORG: putative low-complexity protein [Arthrobacter sp. UYEF1]